MNTVAFMLLAFVIAGYVVLDGYDLGVGMIMPLVGRTPAERATSMRAIGPYWNGNEVWLVAGGGLLFSLFPRAYAAAFSGFYLPLIVVLWLLMVRGIAIEVRDHLSSAIWRDFWDFAFAASSGLLIVLLGVALGNLIRGVPLDGSGSFSGTFAFLLNPFAVAVALLSLLVLAFHASLFLAWRTTGALARRATTLAMPLGAGVVVALLAVTDASAVEVSGRFPIAVWFGVPIVVIALLASAIVAARRGYGAASFAASTVVVIALLVAAAGTIYPYLLPGFPVRATGLSLSGAATSPSAIGGAIAIAAVGLAVMLFYTTIVVRAIGSDGKNAA